MRDHVTEELISAYVDGELEGDELKLVESLLAESPEHQQLLAEFQALRASMWSLPSFNLPADFQARVVSQIEELAASPSEEQVRRGTKARPWRSVLFAAASLAAVLAATVMLNPLTRPSVDPGLPGSIARPLVTPVYFEEVPKYVMVYDVTITPHGMKTKFLEKLLKKRGIGDNPDMHLDDQLQQDLMVIRQSQRDSGSTEVAEYENDPATPKRNENQKVEMIYVASTVRVLDQFGRDLEEMRKVGKDVSQLYYDMTLESKKLKVMDRLHKSAHAHFAQNSSARPADVGSAFRLLFDIELTSVSVPGTATFPTFSFQADGKRQQTRWEDEPMHILLILRYEDANGDDGK